MTLVPISLASQSSPARYTQGGTAALVNCYVEKIGDEGRTPWAIYAADGLQGFAALPEANGGVRAMLSVSGYLWVVAGTALYRVAANGDVTTIGSMSISSTAPVYMERNRAATPDIGIVCDGTMYNYDTSLAQVTDVDLLAPTSLAFLDGYGVTGTANNKWQISDLDDFSSWQAVDFERADANPDAVVRVAALQRDAVIFGEVSTEFWRNTGAADFPFERVAAIDIGCLAPASVVTVDQTLAWVASDRTVRMLQGYQGARISTHSVERAIEDLADKLIIRATSWVKDGHTFYSLTAPGYWTWVYDTVTGQWHQRESYGDDHWRVSVVAEFNGKLIAGDHETGTLYEMSADFLSEAGDPLVMSCVFPPVHAFPHPVTISSVYLDVERGVGTGQGDSQDIAPVVMMDVSRDGGATFGDQRMIELGEQGQRMTRVREYRFGQFTEIGAVFRLSCSAKVARAWYQAVADVTKDGV